MATWLARHGLSSSQYQSAVDTYVEQGYRLVDVDGYGANGQARYAAIFLKSGGPAWSARHGLTSAQYQAEVDARVKAGYRLVHVDGYDIGGTARFAAIFHKSPGPAWVARHGLTSAQYQAEFNTLVGQGYRLIDVSGYAVGAEARYAAIFEKSAGPAWVARHGMTSAQYQSAFNNLLYSGYRLVHVDGCIVGGVARYAAIWRSEGMSTKSIASIDAKIEAYMSKHSVPGLTIAISQQERLVFAKGYGKADTSSGADVDPSTLMRVASVSKPITAIAIMGLVDANKLSLDATVFGPGAILGTTYGSKPYGDRVKKIKVRHLLAHTSGWSNANQDPMFMDASLSQAQLIGWMLDNRQPAKEPGASYEYLNFGYCVLGRVIEKVTGTSYADHVKGVLAGCGITRMAIGASKEADLAPGEAHYYGGSPYALLPGRMDAHGGWIATPIDLLRLMARTDGFAQKMDVLTAVSEQQMSTGSSANPDYGLGWVVDGSSRGHNGAMSGTLAWLVRRDDGFSFAAIANTRPGTDAFGPELRQTLESIVTSVSGWTAGDLF
jgi:CubicO group peptidase (beta-lactamase class C family)